MNLRYSGVCVSVTVLRGQPQAQVEKGVVGVREGLPGRSTSKTSGFKMFRNIYIYIFFYAYFQRDHMDLILNAPSYATLPMLGTLSPDSLINRTLTLNLDGNAKHRDLCRNKRIHIA